MKRLSLFWVCVFLFCSLSIFGLDIPKQSMQYVSLDDFYTMLTTHEDYLLLDLRKTVDYQDGHILGAVSADMDKAMNGDYENGIHVMKKVLKEHTGKESGNGKTIILACYTGNRYAQAATNVLGAIQADLTKVYTLKGGNLAWDDS